jgi:excinuclease ABC subunit C
VSESKPVWSHKALSFPDSPGVYQFFDRTGKCIYVGKAASLKKRVQAYLRENSNLSEKEKIIKDRASDISFIVTSNVPEAMITESTMVKKLQPALNAKLKDDKRFPYLRVSLSEPFPRLSIVRFFKKDQNRYFGPFTEAKALRQTLRTIKEIFGIPSCRTKIKKDKPKSPCLEHQIKHCLAPCAGLISEKDYQNAVKEMLYFLEGRTHVLLGYLENRMNEEARKLNFEGAAKVRDQIFALKKIMEQQTVLSQAPINRDVIALYRESGEACLTVLKIREGKLIGSDHFTLLEAAGEEADELTFTALSQYYERAVNVPPEIVTPLKPRFREAFVKWMEIMKGQKVSLPEPRGERKKQLEIAYSNAREHLQVYTRTKSLSVPESLVLEKARMELGLSKVPHTIEGFDISNLGSKEAVGAKVLFTNAKKDTSGYRHYRIKLSFQDDYEMIRELLRRRLSSEERVPDLILIDGGLGHLHTALDVLETQGKKIEVISLAKEKELIYAPQFPEPIILPANSPVLQLLERVRDEAHRFANAFHRKLRSNAIRKSSIEEIPGIGQSKKMVLLRAFGSFMGLKKASLLEIASVPGIGENMAKKIYTYLHGKKEQEGLG